ncbi:MAG: ATP-NAD kinase family protein [Haloferacaceae archaeon]
MHVGVVVNPIAGMGGRVGLKGTDDKLEEARERGAEPRAPERARRALDRLAAVAPGTRVSTVADPMGESLVREAGLEPEVVAEPSRPFAESPSTDDAYARAETDAADTRRAVEAFREAGVDLVLFVGGDGTAADVAEALEGSQIPMLGVPAGVKVYSSVFAVSPEDAAAVATSFERTERREVMDIDEDEYREGEVNPELRAIAHVPVAENLQSSKQLGGGTVESLAEGFARDVEEGVTYVLGPGSTLGAIKAELGFDGSPLGVDVWRDGEVLVRDGSEEEILAALGDRNVVVVTPIGGQGFVLGRGNPQLSPAVIRECELRVVASRTKLDDLRVLRVDTDDPDLDETLRGWIRVRVGAYETRMMNVV